MNLGLKNAKVISKKISNSSSNCLILNLNNNIIDEKWWIYLCTGLFLNKNIKILNLSNNPIY